MLAAERAQARAEASAKQASKLEKQLQLRQGVRNYFVPFTACRAVPLRYRRAALGGFFAPLSL